MNRSTAIVTQAIKLAEAGMPLVEATREALARVPASPAARRLAVATIARTVPEDVAARLRELVEPATEPRQPRPVSTAPNSIASRLAKAVRS